jgi:hypothetical protein
MHFNIILYLCIKITAKAYKYDTKFSEIHQIKTQGSQADPAGIC